MLLSAKEIAERYAGRTVKCKVVSSSPVTDTNGNKLDEFEARILGWKRAIPASHFSKSEPAYVCVEVLGGAVTQTPLSKFNTGYSYTHDRNPNGFGKKLLPEEITLPADAGNTTTTPRKARDIPEWPHTCRDCGSPAQILGMMIDCSNKDCKNKYRTHSGLDLFLPKDLRERLATPKIAAVKPTPTKVVKKK